MQLEKRQYIDASYAWKGPDLQDKTDWLRPFSRSELAEIDDALQVNKVVSTAEMREAFAKQGLEPQMGTPDQLGALIGAQLAQNEKLIQAIGLKAE